MWLRGAFCDIFSWHCSQPRIKPNEKGEYLEND
nr:MAG TPA: hypothetical protein [Caudoviricetes sp.]